MTTNEGFPLNPDPEQSHNPEGWQAVLELARKSAPEAAAAFAVAYNEAGGPIDRDNYPGGMTTREECLERLQPDLLLVGLRESRRNLRLGRPFRGGVREVVSNFGWTLHERSFDITDEVQSAETENSPADDSAEPSTGIGELFSSGIGGDGAEAQDHGAPREQRLLWEKIVLMGDGSLCRLVYSEDAVPDCRPLRVAKIVVNGQLPEGNRNHQRNILAEYLSNNEDRLTDEKGFRASAVLSAEKLGTLGDDLPPGELPLDPSDVHRALEDFLGVCNSVLAEA